MKQPRYAYIYGLKDPADGQIHYVGKSNDPERRLQDHLADTETNQGRVEWLQALADTGNEPELIILAEVLYEDWQEAEIYWIARGWEEGWPLTNIQRGGGADRGAPKMPDYSFMQTYITDGADWQRFETLSIRDKDAACLEIGQAMAAVCLEWLEHKQAGQSVDSRTSRDWRMVQAGRKAGANLRFSTSG